MTALAIANIPFDDVERMAIALAKSGVFGVKSPDQALGLMLVAQAEGQHPATIAQDYDIIQGRAARKTHSVLARFQASGGRVEWHVLTDQKAEATFTHPHGGSLRLDWTFEQAKRAGLTGKDNWKNWPRAMLRARCIAEGVRAVYPGAIGGALVAEEAMDLPPNAGAPKDMGAAQHVEPPDAPASLKEAAEAAAGKGLAAYQVFWRETGAENRALLGREHERLKDVAKAADEQRTVDMDNQPQGDQS